MQNTYFSSWLYMYVIDDLLNYWRIVKDIAT